jgi:hypothetical protein
MKKWLLFLVVIIALILFSLPYILIPSTLKVSSLTKTERNVAGSFRSLSNKSDWAKWWPGGPGRPMPFCTDFLECKFHYNGNEYAISGLYYNALTISISQGNQNDESRIDLISIQNDSTYIHWDYIVHTSHNPLVRIGQYRKAAQQKADMDSILNHLKNFLNSVANVYGHDIRLIMAQDTTLIVINLKTSSPPTTEEIYRCYKSLRAYAAANNAKENNFPMLLPNKNTPGAFETFVALSIDKALPDKGKILHRRYVPWKDLMLEVKGGDSAIARGRKELDNYVNDNQIQVMSKTYESLVTDRNLEKDSSRWITRLICSIP